MHEKYKQPQGDGCFTAHGPSVDSKGLLKKYPLRLGAAAALGDVLDEYVFFTPASLYLHGYFCDAPLIDFVWEMGGDVRLYHRRFNRPIFRGLETRDGDKDWNHVLWAIKREFWANFNDFLISTVLSFREATPPHLSMFAEQEVTILDPLAVDRTVLYRADLPMLVVSAFCVNGSLGRTSFVEGKSALMDPPQLAQWPADGEVLAYADALFRGKGNPVNARLNYRNAQEAKARYANETGTGPRLRPGDSREQRRRN